MKILSCLTAVGLFAFVAANQVSAEEGWGTDLAKAKETAKKDGKSILMNFTGSDW